jgi:Putative prokaryotic signal transducing protein
MPKPLSGLVAVAEFGSKFEADVVVGALQDAGIQAICSSDPALNSVAPYLASDRTYDVLVQEADLERARGVIDDLPNDLPDAFSDEAVGDWPPPNRARVFARRASMTILIAVLVLFVLLGLAQLIR